MRSNLFIFSKIKELFYFDRKFSQYLDQIIAIIFAVFFFCFYARFGMRLSHGVYANYMNLAFDFDPPIFVNSLTNNESTGISYKHPLIFLFRFFSSPFLALGFSKNETASLVIAMFGGMTTGVVYQFSRFSRFGIPEAIAGTVFFAVSSTAMFTSIIVESYGFSCFAIALVWFLYVKHLSYPPNSTIGRLIAAILISGITVTNIVHSIVAEFFILSRITSYKKTLIRIGLFGMTAGLGIVVILIIFQPVGLFNIIQHPAQTAKEVYWLKSNTGDANFFNLLQTYFTYSFFSPNFTKVFLSNDVFMLDFREFNFSSIQNVLIIFWWFFLFIGVFLGLKDPHFKHVAISLILVIIFNFVLHLNYQFRGSVYLYAAHFHFPLFALSMGAAPWVTTQDRKIRFIYFCFLLLLIALALITNMHRVSEFVLLFDKLAFIPDATVQLRR